MDDLISRQAAIDALNHELRCGAVINQCGLEVAYEVIEDLPPAQPKRGRWVLVCDNNGMHFICDKCGAWRYHQEQNFCGECGADMREVTTCD